jgi:membrane-associated phospholipid phosphatase
LGIILLGVGLKISSSTPYDRFFQERDPSLSFPWVQKEEVPVSLLAVLAYVIPTVLIIGTQITMRLTIRYFKNTRSPTSYTQYVLMPHLGLIEGIGVTTFMTQVIKNFCGRKRPNFFAMCNYKGYRTALETGNFTYYNSVTVEGAIGSLAHCLETDGSVLREAQYSFPSGHSSTIFAGLTFLCLYFLHVVPKHYMKGRFGTPASIRFLPTHIIVMILLMLASLLVAGTRTRDYWHNFDDIMGGAVLGFGVSCFTFWLNHARVEQMEEKENGGGKIGKETVHVSDV